ncbi:hypothetical protein MMC27_005440 [Xylographa pallens]|nr:hypothetical protein [Xylographa pallens]
MSICAHCEPERVQEENLRREINHDHNASMERLWNPSRGIKFAAPSRNYTWNLSQKIAFSTTVSCFVQGSREDKSCRRKESFATVSSASGRSSVLGHVHHRCLSTGALFSPDLPIDSAITDYGLGRYFGDDEPRRTIVSKKSKTLTNSSASNRKKMPLPISAKKTAKDTRHSSAQLAKPAVSSESKQPLDKQTRLAGRGPKRETRTSHKSQASRASVEEVIDPDDHAGEAGTHSARGLGEHSTASENILKDGTPALEPIAVFPAEQPQTVRNVAQFATAGKLANCEALFLQEQSDENGNFTTSEVVGVGTEKDYVRSRFPDASRSLPQGTAAHVELRLARQALQQEESPAHWMELDTLANEDGRSFSDVKPLALGLEDQYPKLREIFRPSDRGWTMIKIALEEARGIATSRRALDPIFYEIMVLITEYKSRTHGYRKLRHYRNYLDQFSLLSAAQKYMLLRDIREYMILALIHQCREGYDLLRYCFLHYRHLREERLPFVKRLRKWPWVSVAARRHPFIVELNISARDSYHLFLLLYHCPAGDDLYTAAMHVRNVNGGLVATKESLRHVQVVWTTFWANVGQTMNKRSLRFKHLISSEAMDPGFLMSGLRDYEEVCVRRSNYDLLAVLRQNPAIIPGMGRMSKEIDQSQPQQECSTVLYASPASSLCAKDEATASEPALEQPLAINTSLDTPMNAHDKPAKTMTSTPSSFVLVTPPAFKTDSSPKSVSSWSSGQIVLGKRDIEIIPDETHVPSHNDDQRNVRPFHKPLSYQIPEAKLKEAMLASRNAAPAYWQYSLYRNLAGQMVKVHYCTSKATTEIIAKLFLDKKVVGFDVEWKPNAQYSDGIRRNVSLIQLASEERIALFHIARFSQGDTLGDLLAPTLKVIMEDPKISKVGVSVKSDCTRLRKSMGIEARGLFELSHLYKLIKYSANDAKKIDKKLVALAKQVEDHLQLPLYKGEVRWSDWSRPLNFQQIQYAASDSYAGLQLFDVMEGKRKALEPTPPRPEYAELDLPIRLATGETNRIDDKSETTAETASTTNTPLHGIEEMTRDFRQISVEDKEENKVGEKPSSGKPDHIVKAEHWVNQWRSNLPKSKKSKAGVASLRAYSLWHHQALEVLDTASLLRDPPLLESTVASYIFEAIRIEDLPYEDTRLGELFKHLSKAQKRRYKDLRDRTLSIRLHRDSEIG